MKKSFKVGDHVTWNSDVGLVTGRVTKIHTRDLDLMGHTFRASNDEPRYEVKSDKTDHTAIHKAAALHKVASK